MPLKLLRCAERNRQHALSLYDIYKPSVHRLSHLQTPRSSVCHRSILLLLIPLFITPLAVPLTVLAEESSETSMYYLGDVVNAGLDSRFSENNEAGQWAARRWESQVRI